MIIKYIFWCGLLIYVLAMMNWVLQECELYINFIEKIKNLFKKKNTEYITERTHEILHKEYFGHQIWYENEETIKSGKMIKFPLLKAKK